MNKVLMGAALVASLGLAGCGSLSQVNSDGTTDDPVFPDVTDVKLDNGTYPSVESVSAVLTHIADHGVTRDQLYDLLGRPHFSEGFRVREWDYLFHFTTPEGRQTCQFKALFDKDRIARTVHWAPTECASLFNQQPAPQSFSLSADVGFAFDSAVLTTAGVDAVSTIADSLKQVSELEGINVAGHTDRIGADAYNLNLSQQRANAVRRELVNQGLPAAKINAQGYGKQQPVVQCDQQERNALITCLAPNRRVDIDVQAKR